MLERFEDILGRSEFRSNRAEFYEDMADRMKEGASFFEEIEWLRTSAGKRKKPGLSRLYGKIARRLEEGKTMSKSLRDVVPDTDLLMLEAADFSGKPFEGLMFAARAVRGVTELRKIIKGAVRYPILIYVMFSAVLVAFAYFVLPMFEKVLPVKYWPAIGQAVASAATFVREYGIFIAIFTLLMVVGFFASLPRWTGEMRSKLDRWLPYSIYRDYQAAVFLVSLASLMQSGSSLIGALEKLKDTSKGWMRWQIARVIRKMQNNPSDPSAGFSTGLLSENLADRLHSYGRRGARFEEAIVKVGIAQMDKTIEVIKGRAKALNLALITVAGVFLIFFVGGAMFTALTLDSGIKMQMHRTMH